MAIQLYIYVKVLYIAEASTAETMMGFLQQEGISPEQYRASDQLVVASSRDTYLERDQFDPEAMIELLRRETDKGSPRKG